MRATIRGIWVLGICVGVSVLANCWRAETRAGAWEPHIKANTGALTAAKIASSWDQKGAAGYLDQRAVWWMGWQKAARDHETFCISCHTAVPYAIARQALRGALGESGLSENERRILENVTKRVRLWKEVAPFYSDKDRGVYKTVESRGTESVLNALILASNEASSTARDDTQGREAAVFSRVALKNMWDEQQTSGEKKGAWLWLRFNNEPWEADDSDYFGAALGAIAVGTEPGNYRELPEIQGNIRSLREYLDREYAKQTLEKRVFLLWASAKLPGVLDEERKGALIQEIFSKQHLDGGWSLSSIAGEWKREDGTAQELKSDGYASGLIVFALLEAGVPREKVELKRGLDWLVQSQSAEGGYWWGYSLNKNEEHHIAPETALFMRDAATAYAVLALSEAGRN